MNRDAENPVIPKPYSVPSESAQTSALARFGRWVHEHVRTDVEPLDYDSIWRWSTSEPSEFWASVARYFDTRFSTPAVEILQSTGVEDATWFNGASLNYAREALAGTDDAVALKTYDESGWVEDVTYGELRRRVAVVAAELAESGVTPGDVVAGYLPNRSEAVVAFLASASIGAIWSQCAPDYGASAALDRFAQINPVVLVASSTYQYGGRSFDRRAEIHDIVSGLPDLKLLILTGDDVETGWPTGMPTRSWRQILESEPSELRITDVAFEHPLWILFTSGTTGKPKGIVHGHGGIVLEHRKLLAFHLDIREGEPFFWYSSTNWVMWNIQVSALLLGATAVLYDGSPGWPNNERLWELAAETQCVAFGASPGYLTACERDGVRPDVPRIRVVGSTGAVLTAMSYAWLSEALGHDILVNSISGGTDVASAFVGAAPLTPVWAGELSRPCLGVAAEARSLDGTTVLDRSAELAVTSPMPSMPLYFWDDPNDARLHETYFSTLPGVWCQGDSITHTSHGSIVIHGRSDATLNRNGVRFGSAEIYDVVERHAAVVDAVIVGVDGESGEYWMPLFVVSVDSDFDRIAEELRSSIRTSASPRHVPDDIIAVTALPKTRTGKRLEVPLKKALQGEVSEALISRGAIDDENAWAELLTVGLARRPW